jgi:hypothetical protein
MWGIGWREFYFPSPSLEEEGEVLFCHSEQREETPVILSAM